MEDDINTIFRNVKEVFEINKQILLGKGYL